MAFRRRVLLFFASCIGLLLPLMALAAPMSPNDYFYTAYSGRDGVGTIQGLHDVISGRYFSNFIDTHGAISAIDSPQPNFVYTYTDWKNTSGTKLGTRQDIKNPDGNFLVTNYIDLQGRVHIGGPDAPAVVPNPQPTSTQQQSSQAAGQSPQAGSLGSSLNSNNTTNTSANTTGTSNSVTNSNSGQISGLIPCNGTDCQACSVVSLIQNVINFAIGLSIPIAMALFAWAGVLYYTSATNLHNIEHAKAIFSSAIIGFVVALGAYLIIETILHGILNDKYFQGWNKIECVDNDDRPTGKNIGDLLTQVLGTPGAQLTVLATEVVATCEQGTYNDKQEACVNAQGSVIAQPVMIRRTSKGGSGTQCTNLNCSVDTYMSAGLTSAQANVMSCIAMTENSGRSTGCNGNACGTQQVMITVNKLVGSACSPTGELNCPAMCKGANGVAVKTAACQPCFEAANNYLCNAQTTAYLVQQDGYKPWVQNSDNTQSQACVDKYGGY
ncbi:MAG TPA: pilin [Candidatus Paceibacterota bacterium]|nr:pilin [Candidatus Paceibacterota bacterium]